MNIPLLTTKLYIPPARSSLVSRPRLIEQLDASLSRKLTLISAPAGFGKTTLLSEWIHHRDKAGAPLPVAWLSLDDGDNDLVRFLAYLVAALQRIEARIGEGLVDVLRSPQPPPTEALLTALINQIDALSADDDRTCRLVLILDDFHAIESHALYAALVFLLDHLPPHMHVVIATRTDPPFPLALWRGRQELAELRVASLRFTHAETAAFLNHVMGLDLSARDVVALEARTEGWVTGLQLAALSMQGQDAEHVSDFIRDFTGSHRFVLDYLVEEVLERQPPDTQTFLLQTAILDQLNGSLCDAVCGASLGDNTGQQDGQLILEGLERSNLFIVPLDDKRRWYRYHHLFAGLLRQRLQQQVGMEDLAVLHRRASVWYQRNGWMAEAIDHALAAGDFDHTADLIEGVAEATLMRSEFVTFLKWVEALPAELVRARPRLSAFYALVLLYSGQPFESVEARLQSALGTDSSGVILAEMTVLRALVTALQGKARESVALAERALTLLPETNLFLRSLVVGILGLAHLHSGDIAAASRALEEAVRVGQQAGNLMNVVLALCHLAELSYLQGQLHEAQARYEEALALAQDSQGRLLPIAGMVLIGMAQLSIEWNDHETALRQLDQGLELIGRWGMAGMPRGYCHLARVRQAQGDEEGAHEAIQKARQLAVQFDATETDDVSVNLYQARLWLAQGNVEAVMHWAEERGLGLDTATEIEAIRAGEWPEQIADVPLMLRVLECATLALAYNAQGQPEAALTMLRPLLPVAESARWTVIAIEILLLQSLALQAMGDEVQAVVCLDRALALAEPGGFVFMWVEKGAPLADLLGRVTGPRRPYARKILAQFPSERWVTTDNGGPSPGVVGLVEPLSERELEVLQYLVTHLSSTEIAEQLFVAPSTVRSHIKSIYGKLEVHSRADAVHQARELGLL